MTTTGLKNGFRPRRQRPIGPDDARNPTPTRRHGLTPAEVDEMFRQQGARCAICGGTDPRDINWNLDHDHQHCAGRRYGCALCVRGLLCKPCNGLLGYARDNPATLRSAADYLDAFDRRKSW